MSNRTGGKMVAFLLGVAIIGLGTGSFWMWKMSQPVLSHAGTLDTCVVVANAVPMYLPEALKDLAPYYQQMLSDPSSLLEEIVGGYY